MEAVGNASILVVDWDNPELDDQRPHQQRVCQDLVSEIYRCLHLLWTLSDGKHGSFSISHYCTLSNLSFCQASSCPRSRRKLFKSASRPSLHLSNVWNRIPNWIRRKPFSRSLTKSPICVSTGHFFSMQHSNQPHCR